MSAENYDDLGILGLLTINGEILFIEDVSREEGSWICHVVQDSVELFESVSDKRTTWLEADTFYGINYNNVVMAEWAVYGSDADFTILIDSL